MQKAVLFVTLLTFSGSSTGQCAWFRYPIADQWTCYSEFRLDRPQQLSDELTLLRRDIEQILQMPTDTKPVELMLFQSRRAYVDYLSKRVPQATTRRALYVAAPDVSRVYVYRQTGFLTDVRHECTHALLHNALPFLPIWLDEGLAEYFEAPKQKRITAHPHLRSLKWAIRFGWHPSLRSLEDRRSEDEMQQSDYREAWAWVHFMLHGPPNAHAVLTGYMSEIRHGNAPGPLGESLRSTVPDLESTLVEHFRGGPRTWNE